MRVQFHDLKLKLSPLLFPPNHRHHHSDPISHLFSLLHASPTARHLRHLHAHLLVSGHISDVVLASKLLLAYSTRGELLASSYPFFLRMPHRNAYSWNIMLGELSRSGFPAAAIALFVDMARAPGRPVVDAFSLPVLLRSCGGAGAPVMGRLGHGMCVKMGLERNVFVGSALVFMYVALGNVLDARVVFDGIPTRDVVLWTTMLSGYAQREKPGLAIGVFKGMVGEGVQLDGVVMVTLLLVCGHAGWLLYGKSVHGWSLRKCLRLGLSLGNALVDMYVKCSALSYAERVFWRMPIKDVISWSALIVGHGLNGDVEYALELFEKMHGEGVVRPNLVTFLGVLSACAHAGLVEKAWEYWGMMKRNGLVPELKHHACMVDVLGRAGQLLEAERFIEEMPMEPDEVVWAALLAGCRVYGNVEVGQRVSKKLMLLMPERSGYYALLANLYTDAGKFEDAERVREIMKQMNVSKVPGCSLIELGDVSSMLRKSEEVCS